MEAGAAVKTTSQGMSFVVSLDSEESKRPVSKPPCWEKHRTRRQEASRTSLEERQTLAEQRRKVSLALHKSLYMFSIALTPL